MYYTVYNGCMAIAQYKQRAAAIKRAKKQILLNLIEEYDTEVTVTARRYFTDPNSELIFSSYNQD